MPRYIDADKIDFNECFVGQSDFARDTRQAAQNLIDKQPTADVEPVKHGKWSLQEDTKRSCCSVCNFMRNISTQYGWTYCPHCGAKMDGEVE